MSEKTKNKFSIFIFTTITFFIVILDYYVKSAIEAKPLFIIGKSKTWMNLQTLKRKLSEGQMS